MDIVYLANEDKVHDNIELRYSIRSAFKYLSGLDKLVIVGYCPTFIKPSIHIPIIDAHQFNIARNIYEKISAAVNNNLVSDNFICFSDDYFLLREFDLMTFPYYFEGDLQTNYNRLHVKNNYRLYVESTLSELKKRNLPTKNFNIHAPIVYNKEKFKSVMPGYDWNIRKAYICKSLYCNSLGIDGEYLADCKIGTPKTKTAIARKIAGASFFSTNEAAINAEMKQTFQELYPEPTKWEINLIANEKRL